MIPRAVRKQTLHRSVQKWVELQSALMDGTQLQDRSQWLRGVSCDRGQMRRAQQRDQIPTSQMDSGLSDASS